MTLDSKITEEDVLEAFREACWDMYVTNLPEPEIVNAAKAKKKEKKENDIPDDLIRGFFINPDNWKIYFNADDMSKHLSRDELKKSARRILQHEISHFTLVPSDKPTEAILTNSILGALPNSVLQDKESAKAYSNTILNFFGDWVGDSSVYKGRAREDFKDLVTWDMRETVKSVRSQVPEPSKLWQTLVGVYEKLWNEDLGLKQFVPKLDSNVEKAVAEIAKIMGSDYLERSSWEKKTEKIAPVLYHIIKQSEQESQKGKGNKGSKGKGSGQGANIPDDVTEQMGDPTKSKLGKEGKPGDKKESGSGEKIDGIEVDEKTLQELYERNKENPGKFAGVFGAVFGLPPDDALRLMYRARAKELLMKIEEKENMMTERAPSYPTVWNIGDPIIGKGGLELFPSTAQYGKMIPEITTVKRKLEKVNGYGKHKMIPDLFLVIDSSSSMDWDPMVNPPDARGSYDKAILACEASALYAINNGGKVAIINHKGDGGGIEETFTNDINLIEKVMIRNPSGGTVVPCRQVESMFKKTNNPLLTCYMSDCEISNSDEAAESFKKGITQYDKTCIFHIGGSHNGFSGEMEKAGAAVYKIKKIEDMIGLVIGKVKETYKEAKSKK